MKRRLYCVEADCPECGVKVPLSPSWVVERAQTIAILEQNGNNFDIKVKMKSTSEMKEAEQAGTVAKNALVCPACGQSTPITSLRKDRKDEMGISFMV